MKIIQLILALYLAALTVVPCSDSIACQDDLQSQEPLHVSLVEQTEAELELCSPFCICSCCATHFNLAPLAEQDFALIVHNTAASIPYLEKRGLESYSLIWQPPRA